MFTGFPWNAFGYALTTPLALAQGAALVGIWGLTFMAVAVFAAPAALSDDRRDTRRPWLPVALAVCRAGGTCVYGTLRLARTPTIFVEGVHLRIMQPNLQQDEKFDYSAKDQVMKLYLELSRRTTGADAARPRRCDASDLAGIGVPVLPRARAGRAGAARRAAAGAAPC